MKHSENGLRLRIFVHESCCHDHKPFYEYVIHMAHREGLAGATVLRGIEGYGLHRHVHTTRLLDASDDLPVIVEIVDTPDRVRDFAAKLDGLIPHGTATLSPVQIYKYDSGAVL